MVVYIQEKEMIQRYIESLRKAGEAAGTLSKDSFSNRPRLFVDIIENIKTAAGSAHQLAHARLEPKWLNVRDLLEQVIEISKGLPVMAADDGWMWKDINESITSMANLGRELAFNTKHSTNLEIENDLKLRDILSRESDAQSS